MLLMGPIDFGTLFPFSFVSRYLFVSSSISSMVPCVVSSILFSIHVFVFSSFSLVVDFQFQTIVDGKDA